MSFILPDSYIGAFCTHLIWRKSSTLSKENNFLCARQTFILSPKS